MICKNKKNPDIDQHNDQRSTFSHQHKLRTAFGIAAINPPLRIRSNENNAPLAGLTLPPPYGETSGFINNTTSIPLSDYPRPVSRAVGRCRRRRRHRQHIPVYGNSARQAPSPCSDREWHQVDAGSGRPLTTLAPTGPAALLYPHTQRLPHSYTCLSVF